MKYLINQAACVTMSKRELDKLDIVNGVPVSNTEAKDYHEMRDELLDHAVTDKDAERIKDMDYIELVYNYNRLS